MNNIQMVLLDAFERSGLTYDELAKKTNLPKSALYRYLNGDTEKIPIDRFQAICAELRLDAASLLGWSDDATHESLSADEKQLLSTYRFLPAPGKQYIHQQLRAAQLMYGEKSADLPDSHVKEG